MVHKPKHKVHSFRGLLGDGGEDEINLERQNVNIAYRIVKFQIMPDDPHQATVKYVTKVYRESQSSIDDSVNFNDPDILAAAIYNEAPTTAILSHSLIVFDNILFSRNIFVTNSEPANNKSINYYIEIEEVPVTASTLMQIKLGTARRLIGAKMGT